MMVHTEEGRFVAHLAMTHVEEPNHAVTAEQLEVLHDRGCVRCGAQLAPEPTDEERKRIFDDPDYHWPCPEGRYLECGFGLMGGGYGPYVVCDCGFFAKHDLGPDAE